MTRTDVRTERDSAPPTAALVLTEVCTPAVFVLAIALLCGWGNGPDHFSGLVWGLTLGLFCAVIPWLTIELAVRRERLSNRHVTEHAQRPVAFAICLLSVAVGIVVMVVFNAPALIVWALLTMLAGLIVTGGVTIVGPKVSMHMFCLVAFFVLAAWLLSPVWLLGLVVLGPAVAWARLQLEHHSMLEIALGTLLGAVVILLAIPFMPGR